MFRLVHERMAMRNFMMLFLYDLPMEATIRESHVHEMEITSTALSTSTTMTIFTIRSIWNDVLSVWVVSDSRTSNFVY